MLPRPFCVTHKQMRGTISDFPARLLTPDERALAAEWIAGAGDVAEAYVSNRRADDPAFLHRIVIVTTADDGPSHLVQASAGRNIWIVFSLGRRTKVQRFRTLQAALNSIRPVLAETGMENVLHIPKLA
jgi:hypothetical protein